MFAHCETLVPLAALMGLFRPSEEELLRARLGTRGLPGAAC
jgi:hypothetical protein